MFFNIYLVDENKLILEVFGTYDLKAVSKELENDTLIGNTQMDTLKYKIKVHLIDRDKTIYKYKNMIIIIFILSLFVDLPLRYLIFLFTFIYFILYYMETKKLNSIVDQYAYSILPKLNQSEESKTLKSIHSVEIECYNCHTRIVDTDILCSKCGVELFNCIICKRMIVYRDEIFIHPKCRNAFHKAHILPFVIEKYMCPLCKDPLSDAIIKIYEYK